MGILGIGPQSFEQWLRLLPTLPVDGHKLSSGNALPPVLSLDTRLLKRCIQTPTTLCKTEYRIIETVRSEGRRLECNLPSFPGHSIVETIGFVMSEDRYVDADSLL